MLFVCVCVCGCGVCVYVCVCVCVCVCYVSTRNSRKNEFQILSVHRSQNLFLLLMMMMVLTSSPFSAPIHCRHRKGDRPLQTRLVFTRDIEGRNRISTHEKIATRFIVLTPLSHWLSVSVSVTPLCLSHSPISLHSVIHTPLTTTAQSAWVSTFSRRQSSYLRYSSLDATVDNSHTGI